MGFSYGFRSRAGAAVLAMLAGVLVWTAPLPSAAATACHTAVPGDANGDGHAEVAVSAETFGTSGGVVQVFSGLRPGLVTNTVDDQYFEQRTAGIPGRGDDDDRFGAATAFGDFNGDNCADLAVGAPGEDDSTGALTVLYGSPAGLRTSGVQRFTLRHLVGMPGEGSHFGGSLVVADFDDDGTADLAIGASGTSLDEAARAGAVVVAFGDAAGLARGARRGELLSRGLFGVPGEPEVDDGFGASVAVGDFDGDGRPELAVGDTSVDQSAPLPVIQTLEWNDGSFLGPQRAPITQRAAQGGHDPQWTDEFGAALAAGDFDDDGDADLAVGAPGRGCLECDEEYGYGEVVVLQGSPEGLAVSGRQVWTEDSAGIPGRARPSEGFGAQLVAGPLDDDTVADLAVAAPEDRGYTGSVTLLLGSATGLTTAGFGGTVFTQSTPGISGRSGANNFGVDLAVAYVQRSDQANLIIGADRQIISGVEGAGLVTQLAVAPVGPGGEGSRTIHRNTIGVKGKPVRFGQFGFRVS